MRKLFPPQFEARLFLTIGAFFVLLGLVYLVSGGEAAGVAMLIGGGIFAATIGVYTSRHQLATLADVERQEYGGELGPDEVAGDPLYLPHASIWPAVMALGAILIAVGFAVGLWVLLPGLLVFAPGVVGFIAEGRRRD